MKKILFIVSLLLPFTLLAQSDSLSITLDNVRYPAPVKFFSVQLEGQDLRMAYMDIKPKNPNGGTVMLFHGKNFGGYYWTSVIKALTQKGYRVVVPDQIGFGKSSKPNIHYSFHALANLNLQLLGSLGVDKTAILGHSMGGMLAIRFSLMYPEMVSQLLLEDPIGLEDYRTFVPYISTEDQYKTELKTSAASIKRYYQSSYFKDWKPAYDYLVKIGGGVVNSPEFPRYAMVAAQTYTMIYEQPVVYELANLKVPTTLFVGMDDRTIVGKGLLSEAEQANHGLYNVLGKETAAKIVDCKLIEFPGVGHIPHVQIPEEFNNAVIAALTTW